jgi:hypothetical protein
MEIQQVNFRAGYEREGEKEKERATNERVRDSVLPERGHGISHKDDH